jgi:hypothetical protein
MKNDIDAIVDDLLVIWHRYAGPYKTVRGYAQVSPMFKDTKSNWSPYDRDNGVNEQEAERALARAVGEALFRVPNQPLMWRTVLMFEALNLSGSFKVWNSMRLPHGEEYEVMRLEARNKFLIELQREGCIGG